MPAHFTRSGFHRVENSPFLLIPIAIEPPPEARRRPHDSADQITSGRDDPNARGAKMDSVGADRESGSHTDGGVGKGDSGGGEAERGMKTWPLCYLCSSSMRAPWRLELQSGRTPVGPGGGCQNGVQLGVEEPEKVDERRNSKGTSVQQVQ